MSTLYCHPRITFSADAAMHGAERRINRNLFKIDVESGKLSRTLAIIEEEEQEIDPVETKNTLPAENGKGVALLRLRFDIIHKKFMSHNSARSVEKVRKMFLRKESPKGNRQSFP